MAVKFLIWERIGFILYRIEDFFRVYTLRGLLDTVRVALKITLFLIIHDLFLRFHIIKALLVSGLRGLDSVLFIEFG